MAGMKRIIFTHFDDVDRLLEGQEGFILDEGEFICKDCPDCKGIGLLKNIFDLYAIKCPKCLGKGVIRVV